MNENQQIKLNKQLFDAAKNGDLDEVKKLIEDGANVNARIFDITALLAASEYGHEETVKFLLEEGADVNAKDRHDWTSLNRCVRGGRLNDDKALATAKVLVNYILIKSPEEKNPYSFNDQGPGVGVTTHVISEISKYWDNCQREVREMQNEEIGNSNVSLYQFLRETDKNKLADYLSNESTGVREELKGGLYTERYHWIYPLCASMIESQYDKGMERRELLSGCEQFFKKDSSGILSGDLAYELAKKVVDSKVMKADVEKFMRSKGQEVA